MKRKLILGLVACLAIGLAGCGTEGGSADTGAGSGKAPASDEVEGLALERYDAAGMKGNYYVYLPEQYDETLHYPTIYLMPYDGYDADTYIADGLVEAYQAALDTEEAQDMILVMPEFGEGQDYDQMLPELVADVDSKYATIAESDFRGILGVNVGAYMAYEAVLNGNDDLFLAAGAHMGDFISENNPYLAKGDLDTIICAFDTTTASKGYDFLSEHYFYLDAPNEDPNTVEAGSSIDVGSGLQKRSNPYYQWGYSMYAMPDNSMVSYGVLDGQADSEFYLTNLHRSLSRFSEKFVENLYKTEMALDARAVTGDTSTIDGTVQISFSNIIDKYGDSVEAAELTVQLMDEAQTTILDEQTFSVDSGSDGLVQETFSFDKASMGDANQGYICAQMSLLGKTRAVADTTFVLVNEFSAESSAQPVIDLRGDWYFNAYKNYGSTDADPLDSIQGVTPDIYESWGVVQPCFGWWTSDFDSSLNGQDNFAGYAWYVRTFTVDEAFPTGDLKVSVGMFDEANEVYVNGKLIGSTGMNYENGIGVYDESNPWDVDCVYDISSADLNYGGENTIAVRMCNSDGGGGWYDGPVGIYTEESYHYLAGGGSERITEVTFASDALRTEDATYRIYLPEGYDENAAEGYPVLYMLHGINSTGKSFVIDGIDKLLDEAIANGDIDPMIVVMPDDPTKTSFWKGAYARMVAEDVVADVESKYNVAADKEHRFIGGCSMGGGGAMNVGLNYPDEFGGIISFYGAFSYVDAIPTAKKMSAEELQSMKFWMACGNCDMYDFYVDQEYMSRLLTMNEVPHYHYVDDGTHSSSFYLPVFIKAIQYIQGR